MARKESNGSESGSKAHQFTIEQKRKFGPVAKRSCTDILCLLLFVIFLATWGYMIVYFYRYVDIERTLNPSDIYGNVCGKGKFADKKHLAFFNIFTCAIKFESSIIDGCQTPQVCVERCPNITFSINQFRTNVRQQEADNAICLYGIKPNANNIWKLVEEGKCAQYYLNSDPVGGRCLPSIVRMYQDTQDIMDELTGLPLQFGNQTAVTAQDVLQNNQVIATLMKAIAFGTKVASDLAQTWQWILIGLVLSMIVAFFWIFLMQWLTRYLVWFSILAIFALNALGLYYSFGEYRRLSTSNNSIIEGNASLHQAYANLAYAFAPSSESEGPPPASMKYIRAETSNANTNGLQFDLDLSGKLKDELESYRNNQTTWMVLSIVLAVLLVIITSMLFCLFRRISLAIAVIEEASKAVNCMKSTLFFPVVPYILKIVVLGLWIGAIVIIASGSHPQYRYPNDTLCVPEHLSPEHQKHIGTKFLAPEDHQTDPNCTFKRPFTRNFVYGAHAFNLFAVIWVLFFVMGVCYITLSGAFASYYWTLKKDEVPFFALFGSFLRCVRYHLGSVAFGSLLVAIVRFIRIILEYIDKKCKKYADNIVAKAIMCCLKCCFWCLENFIKFINKNAFIMIAIYGKNFCASAKDAFTLLLSNGIRAIVLNCLSDFLIFLSKLAVTGLVGVGAFFVLTNRAEFLVTFDSLNYYWAPLALFIILSYIVTSTFFNVYDVAIETIFLCYLEDCKENDGSRERPYYMAKNLAKVFGKRNEHTDDDQ